MKHLVILLFSLCACGTGANAGPLSQTGDMQWVQFTHRRNMDEAIGVARVIGWSMRDMRVLKSVDGSFVIAAGPMRVTNADQMRQNILRQGGVPDDFMFTRGDNYLEESWRLREPNILAQEKIEDEGPVTLTLGDMEVRLRAEKDPDDDFVTIATGFERRAPVFALRMDDAVTRFANGEIYALRLDAARSEAQFVVTSFSGGAHCCTTTKLVTREGPDWRIVDALTLDGSGFAFEDLDGDGAYEMISPDNSFYYAFASYADSFAPHQIWKLEGKMLVDASHRRDYLSYHRQHLHGLEYLAQREPGLWASNGFLAAWVATKALLGEFDEAYAKVIIHHDRSDDWLLTECSVPRVNGVCPEGKDEKVDFPFALRAHLERTGYIKPGTPGGLPVAAPKLPGR